jgi:predicted RNA-binding protein YlxR (DUF448 family)
MPLRSCVGCRRVAPNTEMVRIASALDGTLQAGRRAPGRGAWVCGIDCFDDACRRRAFDRALRRPVSTSELRAVRATLFPERPGPQPAASGTRS